MRLIFFCIFILLCTIFRAQNNYIIYNKITDDAGGYNPISESFLLFFDEKSAVFLRDYSKSESIEDFIKNSQNLYSSEVIKSENDKKYFIIKNNSFSKETLFTKDFYQDFNWNITDETKMIMGYTCKKARGNFRGRKYIAWFAPAISNNYGPWKFRDLPGLILDIHDDEGVFKFQAAKIALNIKHLVENDILSKLTFKFPQENQLISFREYVKKENEHIDYIREKIIANKPKGSVVKMSQPREFYLEKIFEWEN